jgi:hypothetical protein
MTRAESNVLQISISSKPIANAKVVGQSRLEITLILRYYAEGSVYLQGIKVDKKVVSIDTVVN